MHLLHRIQSHLHRTGMAPSTFGRAAAGDPRLVEDLKRGRDPRPATIARVCAWIDRAEGPAR